VTVRQRVDAHVGSKYTSRDFMSVPTKRAIAEALLERGSVFIHLDPRFEGAQVPPFMRSQPQVVLQIGLNMPIPIYDLVVDDDGVAATLSFSRTPHYCFVPWDSVFALVGDDGRGRVFIESMPSEIKREIDREASVVDLEDDREPTSAELDAVEMPERDEDGPAENEGNVIPLWPRSVKSPGHSAPAAPVAPVGVIGPVGGPRSRTLPPPSPTALRVGQASPRAPRVPTIPPPTPEGRNPGGDSQSPPPNKPRPPHPHLRRVK